MVTTIGVAMPAQDIGNLDGGSVRADVGAGHKPVCTENLIGVDDAMESPKLVE